MIFTLSLFGEKRIPKHYSNQNFSLTLNGFWDWEPRNYKLKSKILNSKSTKPCSELLIDIVTGIIALRHR